MPARDDSVIRGSLITCSVVLLFSLIGNVVLWQMHSGQSDEAEQARSQLTNARNDIQTKESQLTLLKAMMGSGQLTDAEFDLLRQSASEDPELQEIEQNFLQAIAYLGPDVDAQNRNLMALPTFLVNAVRQRNEQYGQARDEAVQVRSQADADVTNAREAERLAKQSRDDLSQKLDTATNEFIGFRQQMHENNEQLKDRHSRQTLELQTVRRDLSSERSRAEEEKGTLLATIDDQRRKINTMQSTEFETSQGRVTYTGAGSRVVQINLGSADALRPGVVFGVFDADETRVVGAEPKATIEVVAIRRSHVAEARIISEPPVRNPIVEGDRIYSPFWTPGRPVRIALAGLIDITGDGRDDTSQLRGMIHAAGAEVVMTVSPTGEVQGRLDNDVRFLVVGEETEVTDTPDVQQAQRRQAAIAAIGEVKAEARELGVTIIPHYRLIGYLQTLNDALTVPLGGAASGRDFPPQREVGTGGRAPSDISDLYRRSQ